MEPFSVKHQTIFFRTSCVKIVFFDNWPCSNYICQQVPYITWSESSILSLICHSISFKWSMNVHRIHCKLIELMSIRSKQTLTVNKNVSLLSKLIHVFVYVHTICNNFRWRVSAKTSDSRICFTLHCMSLADNPLVCCTWLYDLIVFTMQIRQFFNYVSRVRVTYKIRHKSSGDGLKPIKLMIWESSDFIK